MPAAPAQLRIRAYNVGFGDCFLLSFTYPTARPRHVLIDFGSTALPKRGGPGTMLRVADQIRIDCDGGLDMVVATHRHADHISGFAGEPGEVIAALDPAVVVQPWTEQPDLAPDATRPPSRASSTGGASRVVARLTDMHAVASYVAREADRLSAAAGVPKSVTQQLGFLGETNIANRAAVEALQRLGRKRVYAHHGMALPIRRVLPGVALDVLGPPSVDQSAAIVGQADTDPDEFWHLAARSARATPSRPAGSRPIFPDARRARELPQEARWVVPHVERLQAEELLSVVRILDEALNNTSLILLFDVGGTLLLFSGDAQIENWTYALRDAPDAAQTRARLRDTRLYKVGHHGSLNATPKKLLWELFAARDEQASDQRLITLISTMAGKHGSSSRGTEVPRRPLLDELGRLSTLHETRTATSSAKFWVDVEVPL